MPYNTQRTQMTPEANINLTPFVDIMMVLLIIFMITAPMMQYGLDVNLPQAKAPIMERKQEDMVLSVRKDGTIYVGEDDTPVTIGFLEHKLSSIFEHKEKKDLYIKADEDVLYGRIVAIMSVAKQAGVQRIGMITKPAKNTVANDNDTETNKTQ